MVDITLLGRVPSKKNSKQIVPLRGRYIIISSELFKDWHNKQYPVIKAWMRNESGSRQFPLSGVAVVVTIFAGDRRKGDLTNKAESIMDLLVDCGALVDDNWFEVGDIRLKFGGVDKFNPRATISIV